MTLPEVSHELKLLVVSDFHAYEHLSSGPAPSHLCTADVGTNPRTNPIASLLTLCKQRRTRTDLVICPGDLADKANPAALHYSWRLAQEIKSAVGAEFLITTTGNHDLDSRYIYDPYDPKGVLQQLLPTYPFPDAEEQANLRYWVNHFATFESANYRIVVLNSSAFHGGAPAAKEKGRVSDNTLASLHTYLEHARPKPVNLLICHHHPQQHMELKLGALDVMDNGQLLLDMLERVHLGGWLVIHGHKHHPKLSYSAGGANSPVVLSAGSVSAALYPELGTAARNQFHIVSLPFGTYSTTGFIGRVESWEWAYGSGWIPATSSAGLPDECGFGNRRDPALIAADIAAQFQPPTMSWKAFKARFPEVLQLLPQDWETVANVLAREHGLRADPTIAMPSEIGVAS